MAFNPAVSDVDINGHSYKFHYQKGFPHLAPGEERAQQGATPTFLARENTSGAYSDGEQDFWLTASQRDWSEGEQQKHFDQSDTDSVRRFAKTGIGATTWAAAESDTDEGLEIGTAGEVTLGWASKHIAAASYGAAWAVCSGRGSLTTALDWSDSVVFACDSQLLRVRPDGVTTCTGPGLSGTGDGSIRPHGICDDGNNIFVAGLLAGGNIVVRRMAKGTPGTWTTFADTGQATDHILALAFHNNTLFALTEHAKLLQISSTGVVTTLFQWKDGQANDQILHYYGALIPYSGELWILLETNPGEIWRWDGQGAALVTRFPRSFEIRDFCTYGGTLFVSGVTAHHLSGSDVYTQQVYYYDSGNVGLVWSAADNGTTTSARGSFIDTWQDGVVWLDTADGFLTYYNAQTAAISRLTKFTLATTTAVELLGSSLFGVAGLPRTVSNSGIDTYPLDYATRASLQTSMFDFGVSVVKFVKSVVVDADIPAGCSIGLGYRLNAPDAAVTKVTDALTPGADISISQTCRSFGLELRLVGTGSATPRLKRVFVRAVPILRSEREVVYIIECSNNMKMRDNSAAGRTGVQMVQELRAARAVLPVSVEDRLGQFNAVLPADQMSFSERRAGEYLATVLAREV